MTYTFLILAIIAQIFNPTPGLAISTVIPTKEGKGEMETHPLTVEAKKADVQHNLNLCNFFVLFTDQLILLYFFIEVILHFIYFFNLNS